jgi:hypothetical protein
VHLQRLTAGATCGAALACDTPLSQTIDANADTDLFTFGASGTVQVTPTSSSSVTPQWRIVDADGNTVCGFSTGSGSCGPLSGGVYAVEIMDFGLNNAGAYTIRVDGCTTVAPDLAEVSVSDPPAVVAPGGRFSLTHTVRNVGTDLAGPSTTRYYLSLDTVLSADDQRITGSRAVPGLAAGDESTGTVQVMLRPKARTGQFFLLACADDLKAVNESDETNNCLASAGRTEVRLSPIVQRSYTKGRGRLQGSGAAVDP